MKWKRVDVEVESIHQLYFSSSIIEETKIYNNEKEIVLQ